jgi:hypothetical protein
VATANGIVAVIIVIIRINNTTKYGQSGILVHHMHNETNEDMGFVDPHHHLFIVARIIARHGQIHQKRQWTTIEV